jgi:eukaryotic-like serine/threonine-protein kinase
MDISRWEKLRALFGEAIELPAAMREEYIINNCGEDHELLAELRSLLASNTRAGGFLNIPTVALIQPEGSATPEDSRPGAVIGHYRIVRAVGKGGMGTVYEAVRDDGVFTMRVAIKLLHAGVFGDNALKRFNTERQLLATLDHSNIARLIDGGTTDDGIPYFVMEFVEGMRIDEYCDAQSLSIRERLAMFRTVCDAVHYAHQHLVVHRDIKPGNILVTADDTPKLLDFGIARLLTDETSGRRQDDTHTGLNIFTPEYASPEQIRCENVTTATDVYSLGILLYKLLTGQKPYDFKSPLAHDISRTVLETEPLRPGLRSISITSTEGETRIRHLLKGDLGNIVLMALRKEAARRYQSVEQLSQDIGRYLQGMPVSATRTSASYRLAKLVRRNRVAVISGALVFLSLSVGLIITAYENQAVRKQELRAERINNFLKKILGFSNLMGRNPGKSGLEPTMADALDEAVRHIDAGELADQPEMRADLEQIIGEGYGSHGRYDLFELHYRRYIALQDSLYGREDPRTLNAKAAWAVLLMRNGGTTEPEKLYRETIPQLRIAFAKHEVTAENFARALNNFAYLRRELGDSHEAEVLFRETIALAPSLPAEARWIVGVTRSTLASTLADQGKFDDALATSAQALIDACDSRSESAPDYGFILTVYGGFLTEKGLYAKADSILKEGETLMRRTQSSQSLWIGDNLRNQSASLYFQGRYGEAIACARQSEAIYLASFGEAYDNYPTTLMYLGLSLNRIGKMTEAEQILRKAVAIREKYLPAGHFWRAITNSALGEFLASHQRYPEAEPLLRESFESLRKSQGEANPRTVLAKKRLFDLYTATHRTTVMQ